MSIFDDVSSQIKDAMRARDKVRLVALRGIRAGLIEAQKKNNADTVDDATCEPVLRRLAKQRKESLDAYTSAGRQELADQERAELVVIDSFLPSLADEETTRQWVTEAIGAAGATGPGDTGKVMGKLMAAHRGELDGGLANRLVRELLTAG